MIRRTLVALLLVLAAALPARAHEVRPGYLQLQQVDAETWDVLWKVPAAGGDRRLGLDVRFPDGTEIVREPVGRFVGGAYVERARVRRAGGLLGGTLRVDGLARTRTDVLVRVERLDGTEQVARIDPADPVLTLAEAPGAGEVAGTYLVLGVEHILFGVDHLLFVLALLLLVDGWRRLLATVTAFTLAHSVTLAAATLGWVAVPGAPVEAVIALSIVFVAAEIVHGRQGRPGVTARAPWLVALVFGLLHGFGFAGALHGVGLPQQAIPLALLFFNIGVELGQLVFVAAVLVALAVARRALLAVPRWAELAPAYGIGALAAFWTLQRVATLG